MISRRKSLFCSALAVAVASTVPLASAQISINIGTAPVCPYGYFDYQPYDCAPYGYYGPDWFSDGIFIGAGPWFHGPHGFYGHVDNRWDPHYGYHGPLPSRGSQPFNNFNPNQARDGQGHSGNAGHNGGGEHNPGYGGGNGGGHPGGGGGNSGGGGHPGGGGGNGGGGGHP